jgi:hypothetical protein
MLTSVFVITSTVYTELGLIPPDLRLRQTMDTIDSIRRQVADARIVMIENSPISPDIQDYFRSRVDYYVYTGSRNICQTFNRLGIKGAGESYMLLVGLDLIQTENIVADRIFKISGRYRLTDKFNIAVYDNCRGKFCFRTRGTDFLHTRLWSACGSILDDMINLVQRSMKTHLFANVTIESAIYQNLNFQQLTEFDQLHCEGYIAPWNTLVQD